MPRHVTSQTLFHLQSTNMAAIDSSSQQPPELPRSQSPFFCLFPAVFNCIMYFWFSALHKHICFSSPLTLWSEAYCYIHIHILFLYLCYLAWLVLLWLHYFCTFIFPVFDLTFPSLYGSALTCLTCALFDPALLLMFLDWLPVLF